MEAWSSTTGGWVGRKVLPGLEVRQFEWCPSAAAVVRPWWEGVAAIGTIHGHTGVIDTASGRVLGAVRDFGNTPMDPILGLCWLRQSPTRLLAGSSGAETRPRPVGAGLELRPGAPRGPAIRLIDATSVMDASSSGGGGGGGGAAHIPDLPVRGSYRIDLRAVPGGAAGAGAAPSDLTCVHVNCSDSLLLASGYSCNVVVHDIATMKRSHIIVNAASGHINITRFANMHPHVFATSSFDKSVALWDLRLSSGGAGIPGAAPAAARPIYRVSTRRGNVTLSFDPSDTLLLSSGVDNELQLLLVADGRRVMHLGTEETGRHDSYTRGYFAAGGSEVVSGSSEEAVVRVQSTLTGATLSSVALYDSQPTSSSLYVQSLRAHPTRRDRIGVLTNCRDPSHSLQFVLLDRLAEGEGGGSSAAAAAAAAHPALSMADAVAPGSFALRLPFSERIADSWMRTPWGEAGREGASGAVARAMGASDTPFHSVSKQAWQHHLWAALEGALEEGAGIDAAEEGGAAPAAAAAAAAPQRLPSGADVTLFSCAVHDGLAPAAGGGSAAACVRASAHSAILAARIPVLAALLRARLLEESAAAAAAAAGCEGSAAAAGAAAAQPPLHTFLPLPEALLVTPAMLQTALAFAYTDAFHAALAPPARPAHLPHPQALTSAQRSSTLLALLGLTEEEGLAAAAASVAFLSGSCALAAPRATAALCSSSAPLAPARGGVFSYAAAGGTPWLGPLHASAQEGSGRGAGDRLRRGSPFLLLPPCDPFRPPYSHFDDTALFSPHSAYFHVFSQRPGSRREASERAAGPSATGAGSSTGGSSSPLSSQRQAAPWGAVWTPGISGVSAQAGEGVGATGLHVSAQPLPHGIPAPPAGGPEPRQVRLLQGLAVALHTARVLSLPRLAFLAVHRWTQGARGGSELVPTLLLPVIDLALSFGASLECLQALTASASASASASGAAAGSDSKAAALARVVAQHTASARVRAAQGLGPAGGRSMGSLMHSAWLRVMGQPAAQLSPNWAVHAAASSLLLCAMHCALQQAPLTASLGVVAALHSRAAAHAGGGAAGGEGAGDAQGPPTRRQRLGSHDACSAGGSGSAGAPSPPGSLSAAEVAGALEILMEGVPCARWQHPSSPSSASASPLLTSMSGRPSAAPLHAGCSPAWLAREGSPAARARAASFSAPLPHFSLEGHAMEEPGAGGGAAPAAAAAAAAARSRTAPFRPYAEDPLLRRSGLTFVPRCYLHQMVLTGSWDAAAETGSALSTRLLLVGGRGLSSIYGEGLNREVQDVLVPSRVLVSLTAGVVKSAVAWEGGGGAGSSSSSSSSSSGSSSGGGGGTAAAAAAPAAGGEVPSPSLWYKQDASGAGGQGAPPNFSYHRACPFTPGAPRYVTVFPAFSNDSADYGPASNGYTEPYLRASATPWDGLKASASVPVEALRGLFGPPTSNSPDSARGGAERAVLPAVALPASLSPVAAQAWLQSRVYLLDSWTGSWTCVSPQWNMGSGVHTAELSPARQDLSELSSVNLEAMEPGLARGPGAAAACEAEPNMTLPYAPEAAAAIARRLPCPPPASNFSAVLWEDGDACSGVGLPSGAASTLPLPLRAGAPLPTPGGPPTVCFTHHLLYGGHLCLDFFRPLVTPEGYRAIERPQHAGGFEVWHGLLRVLCTRTETVCLPPSAGSAHATYSQCSAMEWLAPRVVGEEIAGKRFAHAACMASLPSAEGGPAMVVHGGMFAHGARALCVLGLEGGAPEQHRARGPGEHGWAHALSFQWREPVVFGAPPPDTLYAHTLVSLHSYLAGPAANAAAASGAGAGAAPAELRSRTLILFGGGRGHAHERSNAVHICTLARSPDGFYVATWSSPRALFLGGRSGALAPQERERHTATYAPGWSSTHAQVAGGEAVPGAMIVFGGYGRAFDDDDDEEEEEPDGLGGEEDIGEEEEEEEEGEEVGEEEGEEDEEDDEEEDEEEEEELSIAAQLSALQAELLKKKADEEEGASASAGGASGSGGGLFSLLDKLLGRKSKAGAAEAAAAAAARPPPPPNTTSSHEEHAEPFASPSARVKINVVDSKVWALHLGLKALGPASLPLHVSPLSPALAALLPDPQRLAPHATPLSVTAQWRRAPTECLDAGETPMAPVPSPALAHDLLALVPGGAMLAAASQAGGGGGGGGGGGDSGAAGMGEGEPGGTEEGLSSALEAALLPAGPAAGAAPYSPLHHSDFSLRLGALTLPTFSWLLTRASPLFAAMLQGAAGGGGSSAGSASAAGFQEAASRCMTLSAEGEEEGGQGGISPATLVRVLAFVCCGKLMLCERDHPSAAMSLLVAAEQLSLAELSRGAEAHLMACVGNDSVCGLLQWADAFLAVGAGAADGAAAAPPAAAAAPAPGSGSPAPAAAPGAGGAPLEQGPPQDAAAKDSVTAPALTTVAQLPHTSMRGTALSGEVLRASCISHILRHYDQITAGEDFAALPEHLQKEVAQAAQARHAYSQDLLPPHQGEGGGE